MVEDVRLMMAFRMIYISYNSGLAETLAPAKAKTFGDHPDIHCRVCPKFYLYLDKRAVAWILKHV